MKCNCECHTNEHFKHMRACCCMHQYKYNCPVEDCWNYWIGEEISLGTDDSPGRKEENE